MQEYCSLFIVTPVVCESLCLVLILQCSTSVSTTLAKWQFMKSNLMLELSRKYTCIYVGRTM